jgi:flagellar basal-body rod modification protein FlgD
MAIQNVGSTDSTGTSNQSSQTLPNQTVTQDDFLKLLISQLQNQDPLQPMDNQQFAVQLATFNSLSQLIDIDNKLGSLQTAQGTTNQFNAASLIGKEVVTSGNTVNLQSGKATPIGYQLAANAAKVVVNIQDSGGGIVRQLNAGQQNAGDQTITWDGKSASGNAAPSGVYTFAINAFDINGKQISASGQVQGVVTGVTLNGSEPVLELGNLQVPFSRVTSVRALN